MTNSIWHKASEKPELNKYVVVRKHGFAQWKVFKFDNKTTFYEPFTDDLWAYLIDVLAQADKAERLQKAVDIANEALKYARQRGLDNTATLFAVGTKADKALIEIKQLIKGE